MSNPLLNDQPLPAFKKIDVQHIEPALENILQDNRQQIKTLLANTQHYDWENFVYPLEQLEDRLSKMWSPVSHLNAVKNSSELRTAYNACLPKLAQYSTELGQNEALYQAFEQIKTNSVFTKLDSAQQKIINNQLRDFKLAGVSLSNDKKQQYLKLQTELSQLSSKFEENVLDATQAWARLVIDQDDLAGLPEHAIHQAKQIAKSKNQQGWLFTLEMPSYIAVMTHADNAALREEMYQAFVTRASDVGPNANRFDNSSVMQDILIRRLKLAKLLGFNNYAEYSLATKMVETPAQVLDFLHTLAEKSVAKARAEFQELSEFAKQQYHVSELKPWDIAYYSEKLRKHKYDISQEQLRPYFPEDTVLNGLFTIVKRLYAIDIKERKDIETWHPSVRFFELFDASGELRAQCYLDLYARENKRGGAWMDECRVRRQLPNKQLQTPVAYITCNFNSPVADQPALFTHDDVNTLFHEFGHGLHHMLTKINYADVSGINGVPWDAVELPSQFFENWCWEREAINLIAKHWQTNEPLPEDLFNKMHAAKNFQTAMQMVRQLEFALFDFRLHAEFDPKTPKQIQKILDEVRQEVSVIPAVSYNRFQHGFSHIFAGGYAAGYYSYKWAEVMAADAFGKFLENGIFDKKTGQEFLTHILEQGGSAEPLELFIRFRGREPQVDALLEQSGIL